MFELPGISDYLYESPFCGYALQLFTASKQFCGATNAYPERAVFKLDKTAAGHNYRLLAQFRHHSVAFLERFKDTPVVAKQVRN